MANVQSIRWRFLLGVSGVARASFRIPPDCHRRFPGWRCVQRLLAGVGQRQCRARTPMFPMSSWSHARSS